MSGAWFFVLVRNVLLLFFFFNYLKYVITVQSIAIPLFKKCTGTNNASFKNYQ